MSDRIHVPFGFSSKAITPAQIANAGIHQNVVGTREMTPEEIQKCQAWTGKFAVDISEHAQQTYRFVCRCNNPQNVNVTACKLWNKLYRTDQGLTTYDRYPEVIGIVGDQIECVDAGDVAELWEMAQYHEHRFHSTGFAIPMIFFFNEKKPLNRTDREINRVASIKRKNRKYLR